VNNPEDNKVHDATKVLLYHQADVEKLDAAGEQPIQRVYRNK